ncbi:MAG: hypothetical protein LQ344_004973 [Seirophora lacunosa]|nr:MAG: hypothetical protein LQ344_004973 [Seirophora lacunosa]
MARPSKASKLTPTSSDQGKDEGKPSSSAKSRMTNENDSSKEVDANLILTGSLNDLTFAGHFSNGRATDQESTAPKVGRQTEACAACLAPAKTHCKRCASSWYCSANCQKVDWHFHKYLCWQVKEFEDRPRANCVRAILFPDDSISPRFIWLETNDSVHELDSLNEKVEAEIFLGVNMKAQVGQQQVTISTSRRRECMPKTAQRNARPHLLLRENCFVDGSKPNVSIGTVMKGDFQFSWRGPIVAVLCSSAETARDESIAAIEDMTMTDYRDLLDNFSFYGHYAEGQEDFAPSSFWWLAPALKQDLISRPQFQVLRTKSEFERKSTGSKYEPFNISEGHPATAFLQPCPATVLLGMPLVLRRYPTDNAFRAGAEADGNKNYGPGLLLMNVDLKSKSWGLTPKHGTEGTVVVMRHDQQDLHEHHLSAMFMYLVEVISPAMEETMGEDPKRERAEILEMLTPGRFWWFYQRVKDQRRDLDETWKNVPDPFPHETMVASIVPSSGLMNMKDEDIF